jgi:hypothetical protein
VDEEEQAVNNANTFEKEDRKRLGKQLESVRTYMLFIGWQTLGELEAAFQGKYPQASLSARLRDLRRMGYTVERRHRKGGGRGLFEYRVLKPEPETGQGRLFGAAPL